MSSKKVSTVELYNHPGRSGEVKPARNMAICPASTRTIGLMAQVNRYQNSEVRLVIETEVGDEDRKVQIEYLVFESGEIIPEGLAYVGSYFCHEHEERNHRFSHSVILSHVYERLHREAYDPSKG